MLFKNQRGMSLIEVMIAILLLGIVIIPLFDLFVNGNIFTATARHDVAALNFAQEKLEEIKSMSYKDVSQTISETGTAQGGSVNTITLAAGAGSTDGYYNNYMIETTGGIGSGQKRKIVGYAGISKVATIDGNWDVQPDSITTYKIDKKVAETSDRYNYKISVVNGVYNLKTVTAAVYYKARDTEREVSLTTEKLKR